MDLLKRLANDPIAAYGAVLATALAVIRVLEWAQNRPRVIVQWSLSQLPSNPQRAAIAFWAHNYGARATTLIDFFYIILRKTIGVPGKLTMTGVGSPIPGSPICQVFPPFPARLDPGGMVTVYWDLDAFNKSNVSSYALVGFRDARGRAYYCVPGLLGRWLRWQARHRRR